MTIRTLPKNKHIGYRNEYKPAHRSSRNNTTLRTKLKDVERLLTK